jgi:Cytosolic carboxypeptidase N-terminal domain
MLCRSEFEYDLELKFDHNSTNQYSQWFYFKVTNTKRKNVTPNLSLNKFIGIQIQHN